MGKLNTVKNGKGSKPRPVDQEKFNQNFDEIDWGKKEAVKTVSMETQDN
jgi:hypothetical protein